MLRQQMKNLLIHIEAFQAVEYVNK
jgi:hypothetical protein